MRCYVRLEGPATYKRVVITRITSMQLWPGLAAHDICIDTTPKPQQPTDIVKFVLPGSLPRRSRFSENSVGLPGNLTSSKFWVKFYSQPGTHNVDKSAHD